LWQWTRLRSRSIQRQLRRSYDAAFGDSGVSARLVFEGRVEEGDSSRVSADDEDGAIRIGGRDVVSEVGATFPERTPLFVAIASDFLLGNCTFEGALKVAEGWGYSEYTPMESDEFSVGPHDILRQLAELSGRNATLWISDAPLNILEGVTLSAPPPEEKPGPPLPKKGT